MLECPPPKQHYIIQGQQAAADSAACICHSTAAAARLLLLLLTSAATALAVPAYAASVVSALGSLPARSLHCSQSAGGRACCCCLPVAGLIPLLLLQHSAVTVLLATNSCPASCQCGCLLPPQGPPSSTSRPAPHLRVWVAGVAACVSCVQPAVQPAPN